MEFNPNEILLQNLVAGMPLPGVLSINSMTGKSEIIHNRKLVYDILFGDNDKIVLPNNKI